jgi:predicted transcriptional regulator of viral defense system
MRLEYFFNRHPVFTGDELAAFLASEGPRNVRTQDALLFYHVKSGRLVRVRRGLYAAVPPGASVESYPVDPFLLASRMTKDAVLAYHTALEFHGKAYSVYEHFTYLADTPGRPVSFRGHQFKGVRFPRALATAVAASFDVVKADRSGLEVRVTGLERTFVDVLHRPDLCGSWEEIWRSLESVEFFDLDKVASCVQHLGNATTAAKVGFFLEQHRDALMVDETHLKAFRDLRPRHPHYLERGRRNSGRFVAEWNLFVPRSVYERTWEDGNLS